MMKKLGMCVFVLALVAAFALPAFAYTVEGAKGERFMIGATFWYDIGYQTRDAAYMGKNGVFSYSANGGQTTGFTVDKTQMINDVSGFSFLYGSFEAGDVGFSWILAFSDTTEGSATTGTQMYNAGMDKVIGWYKFGNCKLSMGKMDGQIFTLATGQTFAYNAWSNNHIASLGWGVMYDNKYNQIRFEQQINKMFGYHVAITNTGTYAEGTKNSYATFPVIAAKLKFNFGVVSLFPAAEYQQVQWDNLAAGWDSTMTSWAMELPVLVTVGPFTGSFGIGYGQNTGANLGGQGLLTDTTNWKYQRNAAGKITDTMNTNGFADLAFNFGMATPHIWAGFKQANNDLWKGTSAPDHQTIMTYGANCYIKVDPHLTIIPEFAYYNFDKYPGNQGGYILGTPTLNVNKLDAGSEWYAGVQFRFSF